MIPCTNYKATKAEKVGNFFFKEVSDKNRRHMFFYLFLKAFIKCKFEADAKITIKVYGLF